MKNFTTILLLGFFQQIGIAQVTVAQDWTKTDCAGIDHTLFSELDAGNVVIMELIMLDGCMPCINAANLMQPVIAQYNANYADRVKWYTMGYNDTYACEALISWKSDNEINCTAQFVEGADQVDYYGGIGMPNIIIVGRNTHTVYYNHFGFVPADTISFADAIEYALGIAEPVAVDEQQTRELNIIPNPSQDFIQISGLPATPFSLTIVNSSGAKVFYTLSNSTDIDIRSFASGLYYVKILSGDSVFAATFLKH